MAPSYRPEVVVWGLSLIAIGVLWTLGNLGAIDALGTLRRWWPSALVLWGALELAAYYSARRERRS